MASDTSVDTSAKLAVLIDADNASPAAIDGLLAEVAKYGTAHVKRAYGDWTGTSLRGWKEQLLDQSIQPIQQVHGVDDHGRVGGVLAGSTGSAWSPATATSPGWPRASANRG